MAVREIKTTLAVDGEKAFNKAVTEAGRNMRVMASEMKAAAADFNLTGDEMDYLGRKSQSLKGQIDQQEAIIRALEGAVADAAKEYGEASAKADGYRIKLNNAQASMAKLKKELEDANREMTDMGRDAGRVGRQLEEGIGDAAEDVSRKFDKMVNQLDQNLIDIRSSVEFSALADIGDMLSGGVDLVVNAVSGLTEGTLDYRRQMAILEQNAKDLGFDPSWLKQQATGIAALTGDMDGAVEAVSNLARVAPDMDSFTLVMNRLLGAAIAWPDTLKIENLAESLQESLSGRQITGAYSELMSRLSMDADAINKSLEEAFKRGGQDAVWTAGTAWASEHGFEETIAQYREAQREMIAYNEAKLKLTEAEAKLAEKLTPAATVGIEIFTGLIDGMTGLIEKYETWWASFMADSEAAKKIVSEVEEEVKGFTSIESFTEAIAKSDAEGTYTKSWALIEAREKFRKAEIERLQNEIISAEKANDLTKAILGDEEEAKDKAKSYGSAITGSIKDEIDLGIPKVASSAAAMFQAIEAELNKTIQGPTIQTPKNPYGGATSYGGQGSVTVPLTLDGKNVGNTTFPYISSSMGEAVARAETYE